MSDQVGIENRTLNHPFAYLLNPPPKEEYDDYSRYPYDNEFVCSIFYQVIANNPQGIDSRNLILQVSQQMGTNFDVSLYNCRTLLEFLKVYITPNMRIDI